MTLREDWGTQEDYAAGTKQPEEEQANGETNIDFLFRDVDPGSRRAFGYRQRYLNWFKPQD